ncbi:MAG: hypothetical protein AVDCRST_MAG93-563, partial [uncultured Chloroflexia bacterium]
SGAPFLAPSAYAPARSRRMTSTLGCSRSHCSTVPAVRSGSRSITVCASRSTMTVPYVRPLRQAQSSIPTMVGGGAG